MSVVPDWRIDPKNGEALTNDQFNEIMEEVTKHHRFGYGGLFIKHVDPVFDMRDNRCFHIKFRGVSNAEFDSRQSDESMYVRIMAWLEDGKDVRAN